MVVESLLEGDYTVNLTGWYGCGMDLIAAWDTFISVAAAVTIALLVQDIARLLYRRRKKSRVGSPS